jgi:hypothetical protein
VHCSIVLQIHVSIEFFLSDITAFYGRMEFKQSCLKVIYLIGSLIKS